MTNLYDIVALIGGKPANIQQFIDSFKSTDICYEKNLISSLKVVKLYDDLSILVFAVHRYQFNWFEAIEATLSSLFDKAENFALSWVFYRACSHCQNEECREDNGNKIYFDHRILDQSYLFWSGKYASYGDVAVAIGHKPDVIENFIKVLKQEYNESIYQKLDSFQTTDIEKDLTIFAYFKRSYFLNYSKVSTWQNLCRLASRHGLSWVFYRDPESFIGAREYSNNKECYFDNRMLQLFELENRAINIKHPKLTILD